MKGDFVRVFSKDGLELHGFFCPPKNARRKIGVLHIHGLAGNFYENRFIDYVANQTNEKGYAFLTVNTRGHDYISDFIKKTDTGIRYVQIGGAFEIFEECIHDISSWIDFLETRGYNKIILEGHSTGALKVIFYLNQTLDKRIGGLILLSPSDDIGLQKNALKGKYKESLNFANNVILEGKSEELMPARFFEYPVSPKTYIDMFGPRTKRGIFSLHDPTSKFDALARINCPTLVVYGTVEEAIVDNKVELALSTFQKTVIKCEAKAIEGAPHNYLNHEKEVATLVTNWLNGAF